MTEAWKSDMPSGRKFVLLSLCDNANDQGGCYPSIPMIAKRCSMSERTVQGHIQDLKKAGILTVLERYGRSSIYTINPRRICTPAESAPHPRRICTHNRHRTVNRTVSESSSTAQGGVDRST